MRRLYVAAMLIVAMLLTGCAEGIIKESVPADLLPPVNPYYGTERDEEITLYFQFMQEAYLAPERRTATLNPRGNVAKTIVSALLEGPLERAGVWSAPFPRGVRVLDAQREEELVTITLSREFVQGEFAPAVKGAVDIQQKLSVYAIVNSLCTIEGVSHVQILVDTNSSGVGVPVPPFLLGLDGGEYTDPTLGPVTAETGLVVTPENSAALALRYLQQEEWEKAYMLFAPGEEEMGPMELEEFILLFGDTYRLKTFEMKEHIKSDTGPGEIRLDMRWQTKDGERNMKNTSIPMRMEQDIPKINGGLLLRMLREGEGDETNA